jgi:selenocysteine lyase/cysteine desulfurase
LMGALAITPETGVVRTSLVHYTHTDEVSRLTTALDEIL